MAESSLATYKPKFASQTPARSDNQNDVELPLDFSFFSVTVPDDVVSQEPRTPALGPPVTPRGENQKSGSRGWRLNNNQLTDLKGLREVAEKLFVQPLMLAWIDLSFNQLPNIDPVLLQFENMQILYLHSNCITDIKEVNKLTNLKKLRKLTLHGNEIENFKGYRYYVLSTVPWIQNLDFSPVTKCETRTATTWKQFNNPDKPKKKKMMDDD